MKKRNLFALSLIFGLFISANLHAQTWKWGMGTRCPNCLFESAPIAVDRSGNIYESGELAGIIPWDSIKCYFGADSVQGGGLVLVSVDSNGVYRWAVHANEGQIANIITDRSDNVYLFGYFTGTLTLGSHSLSSALSPVAFCAKVNSSGSTMWLKKIADSAWCYSGGTDAYGNVYVAGDFFGSNTVIGSTTLTNSSAGGATAYDLSDVFLAKLDTSGNIVWARSFGGDSSETLVNIAVTDSGAAYVCGTYNSGTLSIGGDVLNFPSGGAKPYFYVAKYNSPGDPIWARSTISRGTSSLKGMALDVWGNAYLTGGYTNNIIFGSDSLPANSSPNYLMYLAKYDSSGNTRWATTVNNTNYSQSWAVAPDACGNIWVSGSEFGLSGDPSYIFRFDSSGSFTDSMSLGSGGDDGDGLTVDNRGNLYLGGDYEIDNFIVGHDTLSLAGALETLFIGKYSYPICSMPTLATQMIHIPEPEVVVYPNPATDELTIKMSKAGYSSFTITNSMGQVYMQQEIFTTQTTALVNALAPGLYYITFKGINGSCVQKFVKM